MPLPAAILFVAALFTVAMAAVGWALDPEAPSFGSWFVAKAADGGLWPGLLLFVAAAGYFAWRDRGTGGKGPAAETSRRREPPDGPG